METNFTPLRLVAFLCLVAGFLIFAFRMFPHPLQNIAFEGARQSTAKAFSFSVVLFLATAFTACFGEYTYGLFPPKSLRPWIVTGSALMMALATFLVWSMHRGMIAAS